MDAHRSARVQHLSCLSVEITLNLLPWISSLSGRKIMLNLATFTASVAVTWAPSGPRGLFLPLCSVHSVSSLALSSASTPQAWVAVWPVCRSITPRHAWQTPPYRSHAQFVPPLKDQPHIVYSSLASPHGWQTEPWSLSYHRFFFFTLYFACDSTKASSDLHTRTRYAELPTYIICTYKIRRKW